MGIFVLLAHFGYNKRMPNVKNSAEWIDILRPTKKDLELLKKRFRIHPVIIEELKGPSARSRVEAYKNYLYLIYYFPVYDPEEETSRRTEIDFLITKNTVITVHYEPLEVLAVFKTKATDDSLKLAYRLIEALLHFQERQLHHIREKVEAIGKELFKDKEREVLKRISRLKRDISEYRIIVGHQGPILKSLLTKCTPFEDFKYAEPYLNDLIGDHIKIVVQLNDCHETISDFESTNEQLMNLKINDVMKTFTILSFLTFPFMLIAALFGMNTRGIPVANLENSFWIVLGFMAAAMVALIIYFKKKGWF